MADSRLLMLGGLVSQERPQHDSSAHSWPALAGLALQHGLGPMLFWSLKQRGVDVNAHSGLHPLVEVTHQTAMGYALLEKTQREVNAALHDAGIPALWLKGSALARTVYPEPTLRPMGDLDVLVPFAQRENALAVVQGLGYDFYMMNSLKPRSSGDELTVRLSHHYHLKGGVANNVILELHYRVLRHDDELLSLEQLEWFWGQKQALRLDDGTVFETLAPEAHLLYLCAHALLQHGEASFYLLRFFDLHQIITQTALEWDVIVDQAVVLGWTTAVERALQLCMEYFATPVPQTVLDALVSRRPAYEDSSRIARLTGTGNRWERVRGKLGGLSLRERVAYILLIVFPARSYIRQRYCVKPGWPVGPYYVYRWFDQGRDVLCSTWKRLTHQYR